MRFDPADPAAPAVPAGPQPVRRPVVPGDVSRRAGWFPDPWRIAAWRWWDGAAWTAHLAPSATVVGGAPHRRPRLGAWLSFPVLVGGLITVPLVVLSVIMGPVVLGLVLLPLGLVLPVLAWLDRVEPEPRATRIHALLWGGVVATLVAGIVNSTVLALGSERLALVVSAPLIEETMKGLGVLWAVRRKEIDGIMDGVVYAGWVAAGFALVENLEYFSAAEGTSLVQAFVLRGVLTPFAHPLFTAWTGLAVGLAVHANRRVFPTVLWGWILAVAAHAFWNGTLLWTDENGGGLLPYAVLAFVALLVAAALTLVGVRRADRRRFVAAVPGLAERYGMNPADVAPFCDWRRLLATRRALPRSRRRAFDAVHRSLARLAALHDRDGGGDPADEARLVAQLRIAWTTRR